MVISDLILYKVGKMKSVSFAALIICGFFVGFLWGKVYQDNNRPSDRGGDLMIRGYGALSGRGYVSDLFTTDIKDAANQVKKRNARNFIDNRPEDDILVEMSYKVVEVK